MNVPTHLSEQLNSFALPDFSRGSVLEEAANLRLVQLMREAIGVSFSLPDDLARHFFTPLSAPVSQGG